MLNSSDTENCLVTECQPEHSEITQKAMYITMIASSMHNYAHVLVANANNNPSLSKDIAKKINNMAWNLASDCDEIVKLIEKENQITPSDTLIFE